MILIVIQTGTRKHESDWGNCLYTRMYLIVVGKAREKPWIRSLRHLFCFQLCVWTISVFSRIICRQGWTPLSWVLWLLPAIPARNRWPGLTLWSQLERMLYVSVKYWWCKQLRDFFFFLNRGNHNFCFHRKAHCSTLRYVLCLFQAW